MAILADFSWAGLLFWLANFILGAVMWGTQVPPHQARSNAAAWVAIVGLHPEWLKSKTADIWLFHIAAIILAASVSLWIGYFFDFSTMKFGPKILLFAGSAAVFGGIIWNLVDVKTSSAQAPGSSEPSTAQPNSPCRGGGGIIVSNSSNMKIEGNKSHDNKGANIGVCDSDHVDIGKNETWNSKEAAPDKKAK